MKQVFAFLLLLTSVPAENPLQNARCQSRFLSSTASPTGLTYNVSGLAKGTVHRFGQNHNISTISRELLSEHRDILGVILVTKQDSALALNISGRLKVFPNRTAETDIFWRSFNLTEDGWGRPFKDCDFLRAWMYSYFVKRSDHGVGLFVEIDLNQCDGALGEIYNGTHRCDPETTEVSSNQASVSTLKNLKVLFLDPRVHSQMLISEMRYSLIMHCRS